MKSFQPRLFRVAGGVKVALGDDATPLSSLFGDETFEPRRRARVVRKVTAAAAAVLVIPIVGGTFAGAITISSGDIEFGQGSAIANACDPLITIGINSDYSPSLSVFDVTSLTLSDVDTTDATDASGLGCLGKTLTLHAFTSTGIELDINGPADPGTAMTYLVGSDPSVPSGTAEVINILVPADIDSAAISKVSVETT